jgi:hypothetical protein
MPFRAWSRRWEEWRGRVSRIPIYLHLISSATLPPLALGRPFRVVIAAEALVEKAWMHDVTTWLIKAGCRYLMAWGPQGTHWDDAADSANCELHGYKEIPPRDFVMTTWHDDETLEQVFWLCNTCEHPDLVLEQTLILHISPAANEQSLLDAFAAQIP